MGRSRLVIALVLVGVAPGAFAQEVLSPYGDAAAVVPAQPVPAPPPVAVPAPPPAAAVAVPAPPVMAAPPVPPPVVVPPPPTYYPPYYGAQPAYAPAPQPRFHEVVEPRYGLVTAGAIILGASWSVNAAVAYAADEWKLAVPVVGPFLETQNVDTSPGHEANRSLVMLLAFDGLVETAGAVMILVGALTHHRVRRYDRVSVVPTAGRGAVGLAAFGSF